jgi:hypothetical protein
MPTEEFRLLARPADELLGTSGPLRITAGPGRS